MIGKLELTHEDSGVCMIAFKALVPIGQKCGVSVIWIVYVC